jgi:GTP cyclohydrolase IA
MSTGDANLTDLFEHALIEVGLDLEEEGLTGTPYRLAKMLTKEICPPGERRTPESILSPTFAKGSYDELVLVRGIRFSAFCEHHLLPFTGTCAVGYIPGARLVGISKLARLVLELARWPTIQERLTVEIVDGIERVLEPEGAMVIIRAEHSCMTARGVRSLDAETVTSAVRGVFKTEGSARAEFLRLAGL